MTTKEPAAIPSLREAAEALERQADLSLDMRPEFRRAIADVHTALAATPVPVPGPILSGHDEAVTLLSAVFDAWENGDECHEEGGGSYMGMAFRLDDDVFKRCCDLLNRLNPPRNVAPTETEAAKLQRQTMQGMADCMDMVRGDLIEMGIIDKSVAPMFIPEAIARYVRSAAPVVPVDRNEALERVADLVWNWNGLEDIEQRRKCCSRILGMKSTAPVALPPAQVAVSEAVRDVMAERQRQQDVEGWTTEHDDSHSNGHMARAAAVYALVGSSDGRIPGDELTPSITQRLWPWALSWLKPTDKRRNLVKAGALLLAEIERIDRAAPSQQPADKQAEGKS